MPVEQENLNTDTTTHYPYDKIKVTKEPNRTPRTEHSWQPEPAHLAGIAEEIDPSKTRKEKTTSTTEREELNCTHKKEPNRLQGPTKIAEEPTHDKARKKTETNKTGQKRPNPRAPPGETAATQIAAAGTQLAT